MLNKHYTKTIYKLLQLLVMQAVNTNHMHNTYVQCTTKLSPISGQSFQMYQKNLKHAVENGLKITVCF